MNILITGATGFLGKFISKKLKAKNHNVYEVNSKNCDLTKQDSLNQFNDIEFDQIFHLATWMQAGDFCMHHQGEIWMNNQLINTNVLTWWAKHQKKAKMISMGTSCAYDSKLPLDENHYLLGRPIDSLFAYGMAKRMLLSGLMAINDQFNLKYLYLIPSTLYGNKYHVDGRQMHFIFDLIRKILRGKLYGEEVVLWGDGEQKRELIFVEDFVNYMLYLSDNVDNEVINIGEGVEHSIKEYASTLCDIIGYPLEKIIFDETKYVGARSKVLDISKVKKYIPDYKLTSYKEGLETVVKWFYENKDKLLPCEKSCV